MQEYQRLLSQYDEERVAELHDLRNGKEQRPKCSDAVGIARVTQRVGQSVLVPVDKEVLETCELRTLVY